MFKKNTQNLKKLIWQNSLLALVLLLSMNIIQLKFRHQ